MFLEFSPLFGEDEPNLIHIFQMGWNRQPVIIYPNNRNPYIKQPVYFICKVINKFFFVARNLEESPHVSFVRCPTAWYSESAERRLEAGQGASRDGMTSTAGWGHPQMVVVIVRKIPRKNGRNIQI